MRWAKMRMRSGSELETYQVLKYLPPVQTRPLIRFIWNFLPVIRYQDKVVQTARNLRSKVGQQIHW